MELIEYLRFLYRFWLWLVVGAVVGVVIAAGYAYIQKDAYRASLSLLVQRQPDSTTTQYYTYDGYYAQQTAAAFTDNALKLLTNDAIVMRAAQSAGLSTSEANVAMLKSAITVKKDASQLLQLSVVLPSRQDAAAFSSGLASALRDRTNELNQEGDKKLAVDAVNGTPYVVLVRPWVLLYAIVGAVLGLLLAAASAGMWAYALHHRRHR
jgi:capsular polysaccharide biosynthesis protein